MRTARKKAAALLLALSVLLLPACGEQVEEPPEETSQAPSASQPEPSTPPPEEAPTAGPVNPLTGLPMDEETAQARPIAVMLNNLSAALPQQGNGGADIIYEVVAEGGITRMLGVYQTVEGVETIGSVRSARPYYIELALGHDALYVHAGGSEDAYADLNSWDVDHLDGVNGPYSISGMFWRDRERIEGKYFGLEHSLVTTGEAIQKTLADSGLRLEHESDYTYSMSFAEDGTPEGGESASTVTVPFSSYKTGVFHYDADSACYLVEQYGDPYIDGNTGAQIAVTNLLVVRTEIRNSGDSYGHVNVELSGGDGWFACGGKVVPITWSKDGRDGQMSYFGADGSPLVLGQGKSYVCIVAQSVDISYE